MAGGPGGGRKPFDFEELKWCARRCCRQNLCCVDGQMVANSNEVFVCVRSALRRRVHIGNSAIHVALGRPGPQSRGRSLTAPITDMGTIIPMLYRAPFPSLRMSTVR